MIEPGTTNLQVDPLELRPDLTEEQEGCKVADDDHFNDILSATDFGISCSYIGDPIDSLPQSVKSNAWQDLEYGEEYHKDSQQIYFQSEQAKDNSRQH